jgi:hypothetical protein
MTRINLALSRMASNLAVMNDNFVKSQYANARGQEIESALIQPYFLTLILRFSNSFSAA